MQGLAKAGGVGKRELAEEEQRVVGELTSGYVADLWSQLERIKNVAELEKLLVDAAKKQSASRGE